MDAEKPMTWTRTLPDRGGWWWLRHNGRNERPARVVESSGGLYLSDPVVGDWLAHETFDGCEFSDRPIPEPEARDAD